MHAPLVAPDRITGRVIEADSTRLILVDRGRTRHALDWSGIRSVEVLDGWERGTSTLVGAVGGALVAGIGFKLIADATSLYHAENGLFAIAVAAPIGGLVGALIGFASGRPVWQPVRVAPVVRP